MQKSAWNGLNWDGKIICQVFKNSFLFINYGNKLKFLLLVIHLLAKKPHGIFHILDDESNFPRATDNSFLEKCHYNHALNELYSRPRIGEA